METVYIRRGKELDGLQDHLNQMLNGKGQICIITGEAGSGKTALVQEFSRWAMEKNSQLLIAIGNCNAQTGIGEPYLPFRDVLRLLTGDVTSKLAQGLITEENAKRLRDFVKISGEILVDLGPDLIDIFVPGAGLITRAGTFFAGKVGWLDKLKKIETQKESSVIEIDQLHIFEQFTNVVRNLSLKQPIIIVLDDLHWADTASISLLFHLSRCISDNRIFIIGTLRQNELAVGRSGERHPLESTINEIKRYYGDIIIDLGTFSEKEEVNFINALIDSEQNKLDEVFRHALYNHTDGNPLFTIELLRAMQERGSIIKDSENCWVISQDINFDDFPPKVEGVIAERFSRLDDVLQGMLTVAAVEGDDFTVQVIASVQEMREREVLQRLAKDLERQHQLVVEKGMGTGGVKPIFLYRFRHSLFQKYVYDQLSTSERFLLHNIVGNALEILYGERANEIANQLARHFLFSNQKEKALTYSLQAADTSFRIGAYEEAIIHYSNALEIAKVIKSGKDILLHIYSKRGRSFELIGKYENALLNYDDLSATSKVLHEGSLKIAALMASATIFSTPTSKYNPEKAQALSTEALSLARQIENREAEAKILWNLMLLSSFTGKPEKALDYGEQSLEISRQYNLHEQLAFVLNDISFPYMAVGKFDQAINALNSAHELWVEFDNKPMRIDNLSRAATVYFFAGNYDEVLKMSALAFNLSKSIKSMWGESFSLKVKGYVLFDRGNPEEAISVNNEAIKYAEQAGNVDVLIGNRSDLGWIYASVGDCMFGVNLCEIALKCADQFMPDLRPWCLANLGRIWLLADDISKAELQITSAKQELNRDDPTTFMPVIVNFAEIELAIAKKNYLEAQQLSERVINVLEGVNNIPYLSDAYYYKSCALAGLNNLDQALESLTIAKNSAEKIGAMRPLLSIMIEAGRIEHLRGNTEQETFYKNKSQEIISIITTNINDKRLKKLYTDWISNKTNNS